MQFVVTLSAFKETLLPHSWSILPHLLLTIGMRPRQVLEEIPVYPKAVKRLLQNTF